MRTEHTQLVLKRREDLPILFSENIIHRDGMTTSAYSGGVVCLRGIDSGENGFRWERISLDYTLEKDTLIRTYAYASDSPYCEQCLLDELADHVDHAAAKRTLYELLHPVGESEDFLTALEGRYLWLMFELLASEQAPVIHSVRLHMTGDHMTDWLPEIYRGDDFTRRFMSIFDSVVTDLEREIRHLPARLDYENTDSDMLRYIASWVGIDDDVGDGELQSRIQSAFGDYESMYTLGGIRRSVERLCGRQPIIIESADVDPNDPGCINSDLYRRLYGENPYKFFILLDEDCFRDRDDMDLFVKRMRKLTPADTEFETIPLKRRIQLDGHSYLGVNSYVGGYVPAVIGENNAINYGTTIGGTNGE